MESNLSFRQKILELTYKRSDGRTYLSNRIAALHKKICTGEILDYEDLDVNNSIMSTNFLPTHTHVLAEI